MSSDWRSRASAEELTELSALEESIRLSKADIREWQRDRRVIMDRARKRLGKGVDKGQPFRINKWNQQRRTKWVIVEI